MNPLARLAYFNSLQAKFLAITVPLVLLSTGALFLFSQVNVQKAENEGLQTKLSEMITIQSTSLAGPLWNVDEKQVALILDAMVIDPEIVGAVVFDESGNTVAEAG